MTDETAMRELARRFFDAIEQGDVDGIRAAYAPEAQIWYNTDRRDKGVEENVARLVRARGMLRDRLYKDRRVQVFPGGFVHQHVLHGTRADGERCTMPACCVCFVENGRITRLEEYMDSADQQRLWAAVAASPAGAG